MCGLYILPIRDMNQKMYILLNKHVNIHFDDNYTCDSESGHHCPFFLFLSLAVCKTVCLSSKYTKNQS